MQTGIEMMPFCFKASYDFGVTVDDVICFETSYDFGVTVASPCPFPPG